MFLILIVEVFKREIFINFLIGNHFFDFNMTDMAREANISYNSLLSFFDEFLKKGIIVKTRKVGKSDMYKLNLENPIAKRFLQFAWFLTKQDLGIDDYTNGKSLIKNKNVDG